MRKTVRARMCTMCARQSMLRHPAPCPAARAVPCGAVTSVRACVRACMPTLWVPVLADGSVGRRVSGTEKPEKIYGCTQKYTNLYGHMSRYVLRHVYEHICGNVRGQGCVDMCVDMCVDTCANNGTCKDMCMDIGMCMDMCVDIDMYVDMCGHWLVCGHAWILACVWTCVDIGMCVDMRTVSDILQWTCTGE